jgi:DNA-binding Lrp family transcriptional regulator
VPQREHASGPAGHLRGGPGRAHAQRSDAQASESATTAFARQGLVGRDARPAGGDWRGGTPGLEPVPGDYESSAATMDEVLEARRVFGSPDYILRVLVADVAAYEWFQTTKLLVLPGVSRTMSHQTMKLIKREL